MGRGRAKAKQTKVARELKYFSPDTDLSALERELHGSSGSASTTSVSTTSTPSTRYEPDRGLATDEDDGDYGEYGKWASGQR
jgi:hypothetical protein